MIQGAVLGGLVGPWCRYAVAQPLVAFSGLLSGVGMRGPRWVGPRSLWSPLVSPAFYERTSIPLCSPGESLPAPHLLDIVTRHTGATICVVDTSLNILYANEAYANLVQGAPPGTAGRTLTSLYSEGCPRAVWPHIDRALAGHEVTYQRQICNFEGMKGLVLHQPAPWLDEDGQVGGWSILRWRCTSSK